MYIVAAIKYFDRLLHNAALRQTALLFVLSSLSGIPAFFVPSLVAYYYGVSRETDNFFLAYTFIYFFITIFQAVISILIVPYIVERKERHQELTKFLNSVYVFVGALSLLIILVSYVLSYLFQSLMSVNLLQNIFLLLPIIFFVVVNSLSKGVLNSLKHFYVSALTPLVSTSFVYVFVFLFNSTVGIHSVLFGYLFGEVVLFIVLTLLICSQLNLRISLREARFGEVRGFFTNGSQQLVGSALIASNPIVDKTLASFLSFGSVSLLDYGQKIVSVFSALLSSFLTVMLTHWAHDAVNEKDLRVKIVVNNLFVFFLSVCVVIPALVFSKQMISFLYPRIDLENLNMIISIFRINVLALLFIGPMQVLNRFAIVYKFTDTILTVAVFKCFFNFVFDVIFIVKFGVLGLAISSLVNQFFGYFFMALLFSNKYSRNVLKA